MSEFLGMPLSSLCLEWYKGTGKQNITTTKNSVARPHEQAIADFSSILYKMKSHQKVYLERASIYSIAYPYHQYIQTHHDVNKV